MRDKFQTTIFKNPSADETAELAAASTEGFIRAIIDKDNNLHIWGDSRRDHASVLSDLGISDDEYSMRAFRLYGADEARAFVEDHYNTCLDDKYGWGPNPPKNIVILTGAGISAESGIPTFRDSDGLWCNHRIEDVATPEGFQRNPSLVHDFYNSRRAHLENVKPNAAHEALAELALKWEGKVTIITQNIDDLHERSARANGAGHGYKLIHMHGELKRARCILSGEVVEWLGDITIDSICPCCHTVGGLRPHIVWFNEMPLHMETIYSILDSCDLFISIGTSGTVYPAAGFVEYVNKRGKAHTSELNMEPSLGESLFHEKLYGPAGEIVPNYVARILAGEIIERVDVYQNEKCA